MPPRTAPAQPVLEVNRRPQRDLAHLIELIGSRRVERELNVHRTTVARWMSGRVHVPGAVHQAVRLLLGDHPGTLGKWHGWRFHGGLLLSPAGDAFTAGQVMAIGLQRQRISQLERDLLKARARVLLLEQSYPQAANDEPTRRTRSL